MNNLLKVFIVLLLFISHSNPVVSSYLPRNEKNVSGDQDSVIISFQLPPGELIHFFYQNDFDDPFSLTRKIDSTGHFIIALYVPHNLILTFTNLMTVYPVLVAPGDSLFVNKIYKNDKSEYVFRSTKHVYANFLNELEAKYGFFYGSMQLSPNMNIGYYLKEIKARNAQRLELLQQYEKNDTLKSQLVAYLKRELLSVYIKDFCAPYYIKGFDYQKKIPGSYIAELNALLKELNCDTCVTSLRYRLAIRNYLLFLSRDSLSGSNEFVALFRNASSGFSSKSRDVALFTAMKDYVTKNNTDVAKYLPDFKAKCTTPAYIRYIDSLMNREHSLVENVESASSVLRDLTGKETTFSTLLSACREKVVLIDFWASWCGPCRAEMPFMKKLIEKYRDRDLVVVFVSIDNDRIKWATAINQLGIQLEGKHYLLDEKQPLTKLVGIPPIPRYILVDQSGQIAAFDAPRPSDTMLTLRIEKLLKKTQ